MMFETVRDVSLLNSISQHLSAGRSHAVIIYIPDNEKKQYFQEYRFY